LTGCFFVSLRSNYSLRCPLMSDCIDLAKWTLKPVRFFCGGKALTAAVHCQLAKVRFVRKTANCVNSLLCGQTTYPKVRSLSPSKYFSPAIPAVRRVKKSGRFAAPGLCFFIRSRSCRCRATVQTRNLRARMLCRPPRRS